MRFEFIAAEKANHSVARLCSVLQVSRSGFYAWLTREPSPRARQDQQLVVKIKQIHADSRGVYGSPRVCVELRTTCVVGLNRVARLMRQHGLVGSRRRKKCRRPVCPATTDAMYAPNLLDRQFDVAAPNRVWLSDVTYVRTGTGWLYLAVTLDLFSRMVIGWATSSQHDSELTLEALESALLWRPTPKGLLHHSDRGGEYTAAVFQERLESLAIISSMSRTGNCWDNAPTESLFGSLEQELLLRMTLANHAEAHAALFDYIEVFYNRQRRHSALDYKTPFEYEELYRSTLSSPSSPSPSASASLASPPASRAMG